MKHHLKRLHNTDYFIHCHHSPKDEFKEDSHRTKSIMPETTNVVCELIKQYHHMTYYKEIEESLITNMTSIHNVLHETQIFSSEKDLCMLDCA